MQIHSAHLISFSDYKYKTFIQLDHKWPCIYYYGDWLYRALRHSFNNLFKTKTWSEISTNVLKEPETLTNLIMLFEKVSVLNHIITYTHFFFCRLLHVNSNIWNVTFWLLECVIPASSRGHVLISWLIIYAEVGIHMIAPVMHGHGFKMEDTSWLTILAKQLKPSFFPRTLCSFVKQKLRQL